MFKTEDRISVASAADIILRKWDEWQADADRQATVEQSSDTWTMVMMGYLIETIVRVLPRRQ